MTDLIFHIGLNKCGSSTLQREVFSHEEGYLGTGPGIAPEANLAKQLQRCTPFDGRQTVNRRGLAEWVDRVRQRQADHWRDAERLIASNEFLSAASRLSDRPILGVLEILQDRHWHEGQVKTVLVLRSQAARLASSYVQGSNCRWNASQEDFEEFVQRILASRRQRRLLDYSRWVHGLESTVGPENVCVLLIEDSRTIEFWHKLGTFCQLEYLEPEKMVSDDSRKNVRSKLTGSWQIRDLDTAFQAKVAVDKWMNLVWPSQLNPGAREKLRQQTIERLATRYRKKGAMDPVLNRGKEIHLSPRVLAMVREHCGAFNGQLSSKLGRDLEPFGY